MSKVLKSVSIMVLLLVTMASSAWDHNYEAGNCEYRGNGGYNDPSCHVAIEERVTALEGREVVNGVDGLNGTDGAKGDRGLSGSDGVDGKEGIDGRNGTNGADGKDGKSFDSSMLRQYARSIEKDINTAAAQSSAIAMLGQSPHGQDSVSLGCASYDSEVQCAVGGTMYFDSKNLMFRGALATKSVGASATYHFGN